MSIEGIKGTLLNVGMQQPEKPKQGEAAAPVSAEKPKAAEAADVASRRPSTPQIQAAVNQIDRYLKSVARSLEFRVDEPSGRTVVSVRDIATGDLIRQFPSDDVLRLAEMAQEQTIVLVREKV